ncbi:Gfo/Idh/MocA family oxidoreductase [Curvibacter sp. HBC61]|uniref:Gfo/Idh/MocA family oxidoreductase n=1 Tax=Curvibacter cyanobacteriorum TaxID=3026422 RepID=A0ABT5MYM9_9BURK|nr:Gfo/Idh/MocA family oxidoreductase [Curvibacter sp. HBC61]MDD0838918.1 Gfo/Idh/MocA family oxidoreductase [Curvibacter sp. HBC61]
MSTPHKALVVGSGSIARRHLANFRRLLPEAEIGCVSSSGRRLAESETVATIQFTSMEDAAAWAPDLAVVASPAPFHLEHACFLLDASIPVLIEKPLSDSLDRVRTAAPLLARHRDRIEVAYNLRYLSSALQMKALIETERVGRILGLRVEVGQYLPDWRPQADYREQVSARRALGGGVLLELSHELDYLNWLFGRFEKVFCIATNSGQLEIDVEDRADLLLAREDLTAQVHLDFLQRRASRSCKVIGSSGSLHWDLVANCISMDSPSGTEVLFSDSAADRNDMYVEQLRGFIEVAKGRALPRITLEDGMAVLCMVEAMRQSAATGLQIPILADPLLALLPPEYHSP